MGNGGDRFGGQSYNRGGDSLMNLYLQHALLSKMREKKQQPVQPAQAQSGMGFTVRPTGFMSSAPSSPAESAAFNERIRDKAVYGSYGEGGLKREEIDAQALSDVLKRKMTLKDRIDVRQKQRGLDIKAVDANLDPAFGRVPIQATQKEIRPGQGLGGKRLGGEPSPVAAAQTPSLGEKIPSMRVSPGTVREGLGQAPQNLNMTNMPTGSGMITRQNPDGSADYYWTNPAGQTGYERQALSDVVQNRDLVGWDYDATAAREAMRRVVENRQKPPVKTKQPAAKRYKIAQSKDVVKKKKRTYKGKGLGDIKTLLLNDIPGAPTEYPSAKWNLSLRDLWKNRSPLSPYENGEE